MELAAGLVVADRFRLVRPLGQGGMGAVWLAQHTGLDIPCAVKFIHEEAARSPEIRARFEREAKAAAQLRSPHVVQILDHGVWEGAPYIAMEFLEGEDLDHRLHARRFLPPRDTLAIAVQVGRALAKAHAAGLVHRDLKPANIFLVKDEEREIAKVLDFGVAKVKETGIDGSTKTGAVLGTPFYMSPEQARGSRTIDHRSDLWALAVVVFQCLTGRLPFYGEALGDLFVKIIVEPLPVPSQVAQVPPGFDAWWLRAASRDPAQRFQTAKDFTDALSVALGVTVSAGVEVGSAMAAPAAQMGSGTVAMPSGGQVTPYPGGQPTPHPSGQGAPYAGGQSTPYPGGQSTPYPGGQSTPQPYAGGQPTPQPHPSGRPPPQPYTGGQPTPYPGAQPTPQPQHQGGQPTPYPDRVSASVMGAAPAAMPHAISVHQVPKSNRGGLWVGVIGAAAVLGAAGAFLAFRSTPHTDGKVSATTAAAATAALSASAAPTTVVTAAVATVTPPAPTALPTAEPSTAPTVASAAPTVASAAPPVRGPLRGPVGGPAGTPAKPPPPVPGGKAKTDFGF